MCIDCKSISVIEFGSKTNKFNTTKILFIRNLCFIVYFSHSYHHRIKKSKFILKGKLNFGQSI